MRRPRMRTLVVVTAIAVAVAATIVAIWNPSSGSHRIVAQFDSAAGLYDGNKVSVLGITVGHITDISPRGTVVDVTMEVDEEVTLPVDVTAVAVSSSVLTDRHVELTPAYSGGPKLAADAFLPLDRTRTPIEFDRLLTMTDNLAGELGGDGKGGGPIADMLSVTSESLDGNGPALRDALGQLSKALRTGADPSATREAIVKLVDNLDILTEAAANNDKTIREFGGSLRAMSQVIADQQLGEGDTGAKLNQILAKTSELLKENRIPLRNAARDATTVTRTLADYQRELSEFLNLTPTLMNNAYNAIDQINGTIRVHTFADRILFDQQVLKEVCNLANLKDLGCNTGKPQDFGPDFVVTAMLAAMAGVGQK
ncbi:MCE family protein [Gordonia amicalis]|uniref:MCE family protein n=1 Tax=Gordonia amicalis TaxID=89053 RepID=UPI001FF988DE|nr:MCE family protein [Gordonia amicalis]